MMLPNQITSQHFTQTAKGGYKAIEVDAFLQRVFQSYSKLYAENKALSDRIDEMIPQLEEYNKSKNSIADAILWAKKTAEKNIEEAKNIADKILEDKKSEADAYYAEKTSTADKNVEKARTELENLKKESDVFSQRYIAEINVKTQTIIEDANSKAETIVASAYDDARKARDKTERIIANANAELKSLKAEALKVKNQIRELISYAEMASDKIEDYVFDAVENDEAQEEEVLIPKVIDVDDVEKFSFDSMQAVSVEDVLETTEETEERTKAPQPEYVRFFGADIPDINEVISGVFAAAASTVNNSEEENSFRFEKVVSDFDRPTETRRFDFTKKDSE